MGIKAGSASALSARTKKTHHTSRLYCGACCNVVIRLQVPPHCIPIHANVMAYDWSKLSSLVQFDVIMMDPPWQLATANPTRGVVFARNDYPSKTPAYLCDGIKLEQALKPHAI